jgi:sugar O-acyltransferase (sialic acid O-acetyltransferase NeuD family)
LTISLSIVGAGGFGREVKHLIDEINSQGEFYDLLGFYDSYHPPGTEISGLKILGGIDDALRSEHLNFVLAIADPATLEKFGKMFTKHQKSFPNIIHPLASRGCPITNSIGFGNIITYGFHMTTNVTIGNFNIFNTRVTLGHDVTVGSYNVLLPNVQISGHVSIGDGNLFGMNSSVLQRRQIGSKNKIGAHSLVVTDLGTESTVFGTPAVLV